MFKWLSRNQEIPIHETLSVGLLLAMTGGFLDVYTTCCAAGCSQTLKPGTWC